MAYNEQIANRIREQLKLFPEDFTEKKMFGGLSFLFKGKMTVGIVKEDLAVRIIDSKMESELAKPYTTNGFHKTTNERVCLCFSRRF